MLPSSRVKKLSLSRALDRYLDTVSVHKRGYRQEFWRVGVIKRHPVAQKMMDEVTTVDIAAYRDERLAQVNPRTGKPISGDTVRLELALLSVLCNLAKVEWGTCRVNPVAGVRRPKSSPGGPGNCCSNCRYSFPVRCFTISRPGLNLPGGPPCST